MHSVVFCLPAQLDGKFVFCLSQLVLWRVHVPVAIGLCCFSRSFPYSQHPLISQAKVWYLEKGGGREMLSAIGSGSSAVSSCRQLDSRKLRLFPEPWKLLPPQQVMLWHVPNVSVSQRSGMAEAWSGLIKSPGCSDTYAVYSEVTLAGTSVDLSAVGWKDCSCTVAALYIHWGKFCALLCSSANYRRLQFIEACEEWLLSQVTCIP